MELYYGLISCLDIPQIILQSLEWKDLHTIAIGLKLDDRTSIEIFTQFLVSFHPPSLTDVSAQFLVTNRGMIPGKSHNNYHYIHPCLKLQEALRSFPRHHLYFLISSSLPQRKHLWTREIGQLFPLLRDSKRLTITCESCKQHCMINGRRSSPIS